MGEPVGSTTSSFHCIVGWIGETQAKLEGPWMRWKIGRRSHRWTNGERDDTATTRGAISPAIFNLRSAPVAVIDRADAATESHSVS
jgi:uncharacterized protein YbjT (DUF2867 family)